MKIYVKRMFDQAAGTYDASADIQKIVAEKLLSEVRSTSFQKVLEIGVGSGIFTELLKSKADVLSYYGFDVSYNMSALCNKKFGQKDNFLVADAEVLPFVLEKFDAVFSSSVFQWLSKPEISIPKIIDLLKKDGEFHFSIFVKGTFQEMAFLNKMTGFGNVFDLRPSEDYCDILNELDVEYEKCAYDHLLYFDSVREFLKKQKGTGAKYTGSSGFTGKDAYRKFAELYEEYFSENGKIPVTYSILYIRGRKL